MFQLTPKSFVNGTLLLITILVLAACSSKEGSTTTVSQTPQATTQVTSSTPPATTSAPSAGSQSTGSILAKVEGNVPGHRIEVQELKRTAGDTVTLKFALVNDTNQSFYGNDLFPGGDADDIQLVDVIGKKKYFVVKDAEGNCLCSRNIPEVESHSRANLWAKFPAPPEDVQKISIQMPKLPPMEDIPISR